MDFVICEKHCDWTHLNASQHLQNICLSSVSGHFNYTSSYVIAISDRRLNSCNHYVGLTKSIWEAESC